MKAFFLFLTTLLSLSIHTHAQSDTAHHKAVYAEINSIEKSLKKVTATHKDEPLIFSLTGWMKGDKLLKIVAKTNEDGDGYEEYYLENEKPLFVFSTYQKDHLGKKPQRIENRLYFKDGEIFKWLTNDTSAGVLHGEDYLGETERLSTNCAAFVSALKSKSTSKAPQTIEGVFVGIEEGDYFHWNMRNTQGDDLSFFILKTDASVDKVIDNPQAFTGKKCRITWKKSAENIPEAGGKMQIEQILSVEWLGK